MKNKLLIIFTFYFLATSIGIVYTTHSCGNKISSAIWGITVSGIDKCTCNHDLTKDHDEDCCKDDLTVIKAKTDSPKHQAAIQFSKSDFSLAVLYSLVTAYNFRMPEQATIFQVSHSPPLAGSPLFLRVRTLLI